jgi:RND family efflux transporter MFP subunit
MSDRPLIAGASIPIVIGLVALVLLQRAPTQREASSAKTAADKLGVAVEGSDLKPWIGVVVAGSTAELAATASGRVENVFVRTGARVKAGDHLMQFDPRDSENSVGMANAELSQRASELTRAQARAQAATNQLTRLKAGETWLSKQELDVAAAEARVADAELQSARANLGASRFQLSQQRLRATRQTLTAPFAGTVVALDVDAGDSVTAGQIVLRILSDDRQVRFAFPAGAMPTQGPRQVAIRLAGGESEVESTVSAIRPELDPSAQLVFGTAPLPAALTTDARWIPGAAVQVWLTATGS